MLGFRVWDSESKDMFYPDDSGDSYYINMKGRAWVDLDGDLYSPRDSCELIPMQSTGVRDVNNVEIFEGDVFCIEISKERPEYNKYFMVKSVRDFLIYIEDCEIDEDGRYDYPVIGNIYSNPELLEKLNA